MSLVLDAGAFIAYERNHAKVRAYVTTAEADGIRLRTSAAVVAQVWRGGGRQALIAQLLAGIDEVAVTPARARAIGALLALARATDVVDAAVIELAQDDDEILTSDPSDLKRLANASGKRLVITSVR